MFLVAVRVKEEPSEGANADQAVRIKEEAEWSEGDEGAGGAEQEPRCVAQESAGELGHYLPFDRINTLCAGMLAAPCWSSCVALRDHTYASTPADECVKTEPSCSASKWADLYAEHAVKDELVLGPECVQRPRARDVPRGVRDSTMDYARKPRVSRRTLRGCSVRLERVPHRRVPPVRTRGSDRDTLAPAHGDSDIEEEIYNTIDYDKDPTCDLCGRRFALKSDLMRHVVVHIHTPAGTELEEGSGGDQNGDLPQFLWRWARLVPLECRVRLERCGGGGAPRRAGTRQERAATRPTSAGRDPPRQARQTFQHNVEKTYVCDICKKRFTLKRHLILHIKEHLEKYTSPNILQVIHKRTRRTNMQFSCECKQEFSKLRDLLAHIRIHKEDKPFSCKICERKFKQLDSLKRHTLIHTGENPFSCEICKRKFNQLGSLRKHKSIIHEGTYKYTSGLSQVKFCKICNKRCASSSALHVHKRVHTGEKPYSCGVCNQRFTQSGDLKQHKLIHTGEKPHRCEICEKKFRRLTDLYRHKPVHTGEKPHCCQTCGKKFTRLFRLTEHIRKHTGEKPFCCEICSELFSCYDALKCHKRNHENKTNRKRGRLRKRRTSSLASCMRDDMDRKDSNDEKTRDIDVLKKENCADHKQVGGQVGGETNPHNTNGRELDQSDGKVTMLKP